MFYSSELVEGPELLLDGVTDFVLTEAVSHLPELHLRVQETVVIGCRGSSPCKQD